MFTTILGLNPTMSARSPRYGNKLYSYFNNNCEMIPFDCSSDSYLLTELMIFGLTRSGSITYYAPYKQLASLRLNPLQLLRLSQPTLLYLLKVNYIATILTDLCRSIVPTSLKQSFLIAQFGFVEQKSVFNLAEAILKRIFIYTRQTISSILGDQIIPMDYSVFLLLRFVLDLLVNTTIGDINVPIDVITPAQAALFPTLDSLM